MLKKESNSLIVQSTASAISAIIVEYYEYSIILALYDLSPIFMGIETSSILTISVYITELRSIRPN